MSQNQLYKQYVYEKLSKKFSRDKDISVNKILFMPTNGVGLGHLTRTLAVARRLKEMYPDVEIIFFTTSIAMHLIAHEGFLAYNFPSMDYCIVNVDEKEINDSIKNQIISIIKRHDIDTLVFDGVFPYAYLINAIEELNILNTIWIQRGMHKSGKLPVVIEREKYFNLIIVPGEASKHPDICPESNKFIYTQPIIYLKKEELLPRDLVLKMWNLNPNKKTVYIQLGEGLYNDVNSLIFKVVQNLKHREDLQIVLGESIIAYKRYDIDSDIFIIRDYPNSIYFNAFDFAIINASYNIFHETLYFGVPTIIFPTRETGTDDHFARASIASNLETGFVLDDYNEEEFEKVVTQILDPNINENMKNNSRDLFENGAEFVAKCIMESV